MFFDGLIFKWLSKILKTVFKGVDVLAILKLLSKLLNRLIFKQFLKNI